MRRNSRRAFPFRRFAPEERGERFFQGCRRGKESLPRRAESGEIAYGAVHGELSLRSDFGGDEEERACPDCCQKVRRKADDGSEGACVQQRQRRRRRAESRRDESGGKLDVPGCSRHLNMRFIMEEGAGAVE